MFKSVRFAKYKRFGVFVFDGHFDLIAVLFLIFGNDLPPIFKCSKSNDVKKFPYIISIWKIWGGLTFLSLVDFLCVSQNLRGEVLPKIWNYLKFCQKYRIILSFVKNIELYQVLNIGLCLNFAKFMELCQVLPKI